MRLAQPLLLLACLVAGGCEPRVPDVPATPPEGTVVGYDSTPAIIQSFVARVPSSALLRRGACPFECCGYGEWAIEGGAPVRSASDSNSATAFSLAANERFKADSGFVRITRLMLIVVHDTVDQRPNAKLVLPGDTLVVLDYVGEGHYNVWRNGEVMQVQGFWGAEAPRQISELIGQYEREWWTHITLPDRRTGWVLIQPPMRVHGSDQCGGPPPWLKGQGQGQGTALQRGD